MTEMPFPDTVPTAPLLRISLARLLNHDPEELDRFWSACCDLGFFYLDLRTAGHASPLLHTTTTNGSHANGHDASSDISGINGSKSKEEGVVDGAGLMEDADKLFDVAEEFFALPVDVKMKYDFSDQRSYFGYKGYGAAYLDSKGTKDRNEFYNVSKDDILGVSSPLPSPSIFTKHRALFHSYITNSHALINLVLELLEPRLKLKPRTLQNLHRIHHASGDQIRFIKAPPQPRENRGAALGAHTDFGSVTVLFNRVGGLQVRLPSNVPAIPPKVPGQMSSSEQSLCEEGWAYVRPLPGHAIINLGDALVKFTSGILRSNIHRVVAPPGDQGDLTRYSLVYFSRPEDEVVLKSLDEESPLIRRKAEESGGKEEEALTSKEWILRRALGKRPGKFFNEEHARGTEDARGVRG